MPRMRRLVRLGALAAALTGCNEGTNVSFANLIVYPILDSLFAGDNAPARNLIYINDRGDTVAPTGVRWSSDRPAVVQVDYLTGALTAVGPGAAVVSAQIGSTVGLALVVVSKTLDLQLLLDTIYLMPGDVFTVRQPVLGPSASPMIIDSLTPLEAYGRNYGYDPICQPLRNWGAWSRLLSNGLTLSGLSRYGGTISITQMVPLPSGNGQAISGRYFFFAQRTDEYYDPLGALPVRGSVVPPLITDNSPCTS